MIHIAILGFGVVGSGVAKLIEKNGKNLADRLNGEALNVKYILDKRSFPGHALEDRVTMDFEKILADEEVFLIVETMGGSHPAYDFTKRALMAGKSVVTSNKEVVSKYGAELLEVAQENAVSYLFEASVGGGIPVIRPMWQCLAANKILAVSGILNGTCNYILTKMEKEKADFADVLKEAKALGYAEADPTADIEGIDTCRKISILASLAFGRQIRPEFVPCEGISSVTYSDIENAAHFGYAIKLLGRAECLDGKTLYVNTSPYLVPRSSFLANVEDVYNGVTVLGNMVGDVMFIGKGAGQLPTASAVMADVLDVIRDCRKTIGWARCDENILADMKQRKAAFYVRTNASCDAVRSAFEKSPMVDRDGHCAFLIQEPLSELEAQARLAEFRPEIVIRILSQPNANG